MISGTVNQNGVPEVTIQVAGQSWPAIIDTGFNGDLELPVALFPILSPVFRGRIQSLLAAGQNIVQDYYDVNFPFDGRTLSAEATFTPSAEVLIGTHFLRAYRLAVDFPAQTVELDR